MRIQGETVIFVDEIHRFYVDTRTDFELFLILIVQR